MIYLNWVIEYDQKHSDEKKNKFGTPHVVTFGKKSQNFVFKFYFLQNDPNTSITQIVTQTSSNKVVA